MITAEIGAPTIGIGAVRIAMAGARVPHLVNLTFGHREFVRAMETPRL